jgi:hypothetical protein
MQSLEKSIAEAEAKVADWRRSVATIEGQLHAAGLTLTKAKEDREKHAMSARLGDATAIAAIKHARGEQHTSEQDIVDLQLSLPQAQAQLAIAEKNAASARHAVAKVIAEQKMRARIEVCRKIDAVIAEFTSLFNLYEKLGHEIINADVMPQQNMFGTANQDGSLRRMRAALPKCLDRVYPNAIYDEMKKESLDATEARQWNLPPNETDTKAA